MPAQPVGEKVTEGKIVDENTPQAQLQNITAGKEIKNKWRGEKYTFKAREMTEKETVQIK